MGELDDRSKQLLALARRRMSPTLDDQLRVREALDTRHAQHGGARAGSVARPWGALLATAVFFGAAGFYAGYRVSNASSSRVEVPVRTPAPAAAPPPLPRVEVPALEQATAEVVREPAAAPEREPAVKRARPRTPVDMTTAPVAPEAPNPSLEIELQGVRRMELALREGQPALALSILDQLDRDVPEGGMREERRAGFVMARCAVGLGSRAALLREFENQYPESMYLERVRRHCAPKSP